MLAFKIETAFASTDENEVSCVFINCFAKTVSSNMFAGVGVLRLFVKISSDDFQYKSYYTSHNKNMLAVTFFKLLVIRSVSLMTYQDVFNQD